jgi:hypothetical protein
MATPASVEQFNRSLKESSQRFNGALTEFIKQLTLSDKTKKTDAAKNAVTTLDILKTLLVPSDRPKWMEPLRHGLDVYSQKAQFDDAGLTVMRDILHWYPAIQQQNWDLQDNKGAIDFQTIFAEHYEKSEIPKLFNELVGYLQQIVDSGAIDSIKFVQGLEKVIATIRENAESKSFAAIWTWYSLKTYLAEAIRYALLNGPGIKYLTNPAKQTLEKLNAEMPKFENEIKHATDGLFIFDVPLFENQTPKLPAADGGPQASESEPHKESKPRH